jgi:hypothetical protein
MVFPKYIGSRLFDKVQLHDVFMADMGFVSDVFYHFEFSVGCESRLLAI